MFQYNLWSSLIIILFCVTSQAQNPIFLPSPINDEDMGPQAPALTPDGNIMYFCSNKTKKYLLYRSERQGDKWTAPKPVIQINQQLTEDGSVRDPFITYDGTRLYFSAMLKDTKGGMDLYYCKITDQGPGEPKNLGDPFNTQKNERSPSVAVNNKKFVFSRINEDADVKLDDCGNILVSIKKEGQWQIPVLLSKGINSGCVAFPQLLFDNKTILYSAVVDERHKSERKNFDLFLTSELALSFYTKPMPLKFINSELQQITPYMPANAEKIYFARAEERWNNLKEPKIGYMELDAAKRPYRLVTVKGIISDLNQNPVTAQLKVINNNTSEVVQLQKSNKQTGEYSIDLVKGVNYKIEVLKPNYSYDFFNISAKKHEQRTITRDLLLFSDIELLLNVFDKELLDPLDATIQIITKGSEDKHSTVKEIARGRYALEMDLGEQYQIQVSANNFKKHHFDFDLTGLVQFAEFERDIELEPEKETFEINVTDEKTDENLHAQVVIQNLDRDETIVLNAPNAGGKYEANLRKGDKYEININGPKGYSYSNQKLDTEAKKQDKKLDVTLQPLTAQTKIELNNINFETNSADLNASSFKELKRVVKLLNDNPEIKIEISAHTDDVGNAIYNKRLSNKRAESVVDYLRNEQVKRERLIAKGYGEKKPLVPNNSDENRQRNRRVELEIVDTENE